MNCETFQRTFAPGTDDPKALEHLRACDACLEHALRLDPDVLFRSLGLPAEEPPGGIDAFVGEVMQQVHLRDRERRLEPRRQLGAWSRWSAAAALGVAVIGGTIIYRTPAARPALDAPATRIATIERPVIESYDSAGAMIVEMPAEGADDIRLVMVFDESLPADL